MQHAPSSGAQARPAAPPAPTLTEALKQTMAVVDGKRPWYQALVLRKQAAEASAGETVSGVVTTGLVEGLSFAVNAANVGFLTPVCNGLEELFAAVKGATAAREDLIDLLSYCVLILSIVLNQALLAGLPEQIKQALRDVEARIKDINNSARLFDTKTGCSLPCRRLRLHARDREEIQGHRACLKEILELATQATVLDTNAVARDTRDIVVGMVQGPPAPELAKVPRSALPLPTNYVARTLLLDDVITAATAADSRRIPHVLFGMGGSGKTALASALVVDERILKHFRRGVFWVSIGQSYNLVDLLERLAARMIVDHAGPVEFSSEEEGVRRLTDWVAKDPQPRLLVLDDVWESRVVDALRNTGLKLLVTTRIRDLVAADAVSKEVGNMTKAEARDLLRRQSGAVDLPVAEANQVAEECGCLALALAIAGSLPSIRKSPDGAEDWRNLHSEITEKKRQRRGLQMAADVNQDSSKSVLFPVLGLGMDQLGADARDLLLNLVVLARGISAPVDMLTNLWERKDDWGAKKEANFLASRSLLQEAPGDEYVLHDLMLDFIRMECDCREQENLVKGAIDRQRQYLGRLAVVQHYSNADQHHSTGLYALMSLWRSLEDLCGTDCIAGTYATNLDKLGQSETAKAARAYTSVGEFLRLAGKYAEAQPLFERSQAIREKILGPEHPDVAESLFTRVRLLGIQGKYDEAELLLERCEAIEKKTLGPDHPNLARSLYMRAGLLVTQSKFTEAELLMERCQAIQEKALPPDHPDLAATFYGRAELLARQGKFAEADLLYERSQAIEEKVLGPYHPDLATTLHGRAELLAKQGKYAEAEKLFARCQAIHEKVLDPDHPDLANTLRGRANLLAKQGKDAEAEKLYVRFQAIEEKALGPDHPDLATTLHGHAVLLARQGKHEEAAPLYARSLAIREKARRPGQPAVAAALIGRVVLIEKESGKNPVARQDGGNAERAGATSANFDHKSD